MKYWKASELRSFLLYWGIPVLSGVLRNEYMVHYVLLVQALNILLKTKISKTEIDVAERLLLRFSQQWDQLYPVRRMTLNLHQLVHLADDVRKLGPLYGHSCFFFEELNGFLMKQISGTQHIDNQITTSLCFYQKLPELRHESFTLDCEQGEALKLYNQMCAEQSSVRKGVLLDGIYLLGGTT